MSDAKKLSGHCYCGAIKFEVSGNPVNVGHCHCESCRRHTASAMVTFASYRPEHVAFQANNPPNLLLMIQYHVVFAVDADRQ